MTLSKVKRTIRRMTRSPFPAGARRLLLVHCCHHKTGTVWFKRVLLAVSEEYGLRFHAGPQDQLRGCNVFIQDHSRVDTAALPEFRGTHMVRDPRDIVISGYFYHLRTTEIWARKPDPRYGGMSYQEYLGGFDQEAGLLAEIERFGITTGAEMSGWNYDDPRFLELRYEDVLADEETGFRSMFEHYGFRPEAVDECCAIAATFSLGRVKDKSSHIRSGQPGEWRQVFSDAHRAAFKAVAGDLVLKLGYETRPDW